MRLNTSEALDQARRLARAGHDAASIWMSVKGITFNRAIIMAWSANIPGQR